MAIAVAVAPTTATHQQVGGVRAHAGDGPWRVHLCSMLVLHTTERVRKRWKLKIQGPDILPGPQPFRHWQVNTFPAAGKTWVLFVEASTYWSIVVPYGPWKTVVAEFHRAFCFELVGRGASPEIVYAFEGWGTSVAIQKSLDKRMLGTHNDLSYHASVHLDYGDDLALTNRRVQECPLSVLAECFPDKALEERIREMERG